MNIDDNIISQKLDQLRAGNIIDFSIKRGTKCGTPELWGEEISYVLGGNQRYHSIRSAVDEGGQAIGNWYSEADPTIFEELLAALEQSQFWTLQNEAISPGEEYVYWQLIIGEPNEQEIVSITFPYDSTLKQTLQPLDLIMRRVAYLLSSQKLGYELIISVELDRTTNPSKVAVNLHNLGNQACKVANPLAQDFDDFSSVSIEVAAPEDPENPTGLGFQYRPIPMKVLDSLESPWGQTYITLAPKQSISVPILSIIDVKALYGHYLRAVFTCYGYSHGNSIEENQKLLPTILGKAFSIETAI